MLVKQTKKNQPTSWWVEVELRGKGAAAPKVAICSNNVFIFAFTNVEGKWFKLIKGKMDVLQDATPLGFGGNYNTLVDGAINLSCLKLEKVQHVGCTRDSLEQQ